MGLYFYSTKFDGLDLGGSIGGGCGLYAEDVRVKRNLSDSFIVKLGVISCVNCEGCMLEGATDTALGFKCDNFPVGQARTFVGNLVAEALKSGLPCGDKHPKD